MIEWLGTWMRRRSHRKHEAFLRRHVGNFLAIPLDGAFAYGRVVRNARLACYDLRSEFVLPIEEVEKAKVLFTIPVYHNTYESSRWKVIGRKPLEKELDRPVKFFREDAITGAIDIYCEGEYLPHTDEDLSRLERLAVWNADAVEWRLRSHFAGACDLVTEKMKYKPREDEPPC